MTGRSASLVAPPVWPASASRTATCTRASYSLCKLADVDVIHASISFCNSTFWCSTCASMTSHRPLHTAQK
jgi:hypothetical protein